MILLSQVITKHGGEVEDIYSKRCTHMLCLHQQGELCKKVYFETIPFKIIA